MLHWSPALWSGGAELGRRVSTGPRLTGASASNTDSSTHPTVIMYGDTLPPTQELV